MEEIVCVANAEKEFKVALLSGVVAVFQCSDPDVDVFLYVLYTCMFDRLV